MRPRLAVRLLVLLALSAAPARAWHIAGTVYCDQNDNHVIDGADTRLAGYVTDATSQVASPGTTYTDPTDASGYYFLQVPNAGDTFGVTLRGLPGGQAILVPSGGSHAIALDFTQDHRDDVDFLVGGCAPPTTTTTSTPGSTATTSTTATTLASSCPAIPFVACEGGSINNGANILASIAANDAGASIRLSKLVFMSNGTTITGDRVELGQGTSVFDVHTNALVASTTATIRNQIAAASVPLRQPCCSIAPLSCGTTVVEVGSFGGRLLEPGSYGDLYVRSSGALTLQAGTYDFCSIRAGRGARIEALDAVTINVVGSVRMGVGVHLEPAPGLPPIVVNAAGPLVRFSPASVTNAAVNAPNALIRFARDAQFRGQFCTTSIRTDKGITLQCP